MPQKILITGGAGYIGSHAVKHFLDHDYQVVVLDNLSHGWQEAIDTLSALGSVTFVQADLRDKVALKELFSTHKISAVLHFAALCSVDESMKDPGLYFDNNVAGTLSLLEAMQETGVEKLIFSSTCAVYGESQYLPMDEKHPTNPANPYGESKLMVEQMIRWYGELHNLSFVILRYFNVCGAASDGAIGDSKKPSLLLLQNAVRGALGIEKFSYTCQKVDTPDGTPIRDYIDVEDLVSAHKAALDYLQAGGSSDVFNLGNGRGWSVKEIVSAVEDYFGISLAGEERHTRQGEYAEVYANTTKANQVLKWQTKKSLLDSIKSLEAWYKDRPNGWER
jgi:UDP-glucose 4-epimerase